MQTHEADCLPDGRTRCDAHNRGRNAIFSAEYAVECNLGHVEHLVLAHPFVAVQLGEIALTCVAQDRHHHCVRIVDLTRDLERHRRDESG